MNISPAVTQEDIVEYLSLRSWRKQTSGDLGDIWEHSTHDQAVAIPHNLNPQKFEWDGVLTRIARAERSTTNAISAAIREMYVDVAEFRAADDTYIQGSIPVDAGYSLVAAARVFMRTSATTSRNPKAHISGKYPPVGEEIAERARLGHTIEGSYILPLLVPLTKPFKDAATLFGTAEGKRHDSEPEERRATRTMAQALSAVRNRVVEPAREPRPEVVTDLVVAGVSREMIQALRRVVADESVTTFDASFRWASGLAEPKGIAERIEIPRESADLLAKTADLMKAQRKSPMEVITGPIVQLRDDGDVNFGEANIQAVRNGRACEIIVRLREHVLQDAHHWFETREALVIEGRVSKIAGRLGILTPSRVTPVSETILPHLFD